MTSSLLSAVGLSAGPAATAALSASIKWIVKDGVGALGRLIVGRWGAGNRGCEGEGVVTFTPRPRKKRPIKLPIGPAPELLWIEQWSKGQGEGGNRLLPWILHPSLSQQCRPSATFFLFSRFSVEFDEDPRRWRMVAELLSTAGMGLEVCTMLVPQHFLALACGGKFMQVGVWGCSGIEGVGKGRLRLGDSGPKALSVTGSVLWVPYD